MTPRSLQAVLRSLAEARPPAADGDLLRRFLGGDGEAFAALVGRHGRLVWAACRHLTGSDADADDAFQATFLVLLQRARQVRDPGRLSAWLHGVAYKVCARARRSAGRRATRERGAAAREGDGTTVADSAWDRALAAVHEEAGRLPERLRVPFVLCCLEGTGVTEAAGQLGWKVGTLSGRLTRAKAAVLARLDARGLGGGAAAGLGLAAAPARAVARAAGLARVGSVVPASVLQLAQGVTGMGMTSFKVLAAAALLAGGLGVGVGAGWTGAANGQPPGSPVDPEAEVRRLQAELDKARQAAAARPGREAAPPADPRWETTAITEWLAEGGRGAPAPKWEYEFVPARDLGPDQFRDLLRDREGRGWEFGGTTPLTRDGKPAATWVFRRPAAGAGGPWRRLATPVGADPSGGDPAAADGPVADNPEAIRAEIARLQARLAASEPKPVTDPAARRRVEFRKQDLPLEPAEAVALLGRLAERKFGKGRLVISLADGGVAVEGDREAFDWFAGVVKALGGKAPADPRVGQ